MIQSLTEEKFESMRREIDLVAYTVQALGVTPEEAISILSAVESATHPNYESHSPPEDEEDRYREWVSKPVAPHVHPFTSPLSEENLKPRVIKDSPTSTDYYRLKRVGYLEWVPEWTGRRYGYPDEPKSLAHWDRLKWIVEFEFGREAVITDVVDIPPLKLVLDSNPPIRYAAGGRIGKPDPNPYLPGTEHWITEENIYDLATAVGWQVIEAHGKKVLWPNQPPTWAGIGYETGCKIQIPTTE